MEPESVVTYAASLILALSGAVVFLWKVIDGHNKKDLANLEAANLKMDKLHAEQISTLREVSEIKGKLGALTGQKDLAEQVLQKVEELKNGP